ncbi:MAG: hypothetical protein Q7S93_11440 [Phenylobacterium sp.]|uniref:hypothetical protein n=1 Tax=Phenylobacterium sp. TaxID=1871053 RepID=UPI00272527B1|nr:hypothetical protein [Phenylobacterium sp.]MDO8410659.1 hypothetical protein [Phenylobacterium sp.]
MIADEIRKRVARHYKEPSDAMLLSALGKELVSAGLWPIEGERRPLAKVVEEVAPELIIRADPQVKAFVVIAPEGREDIVEAAFAKRRDDQLVKRLPRPILLAFCADTEKPVSVRTSPPYRYLVGHHDENGAVLVEPEFRLPGTYIDDGRNLPPELLGKIKAWAEAHKLDLTALTNPSPPPTTKPQDNKPIGDNALERLHDAQPEDVRGRLVVPLDIALALSRLP